MAYSKYKRLVQLREILQIEDRTLSWISTHLPRVEPSDYLMETLLDAQYEFLRSEKAKSEYIIAPILKELRKKNSPNIKTFSGLELDIDKSLALSGFCDFIVSGESQRTDISAPIICLVEAKKDDIDGGIAQCGAEMYAAQIFNAREGNPRETLYGCVTNAFSWCFLKLNNNTLYIDPNYVPLTFTEPHRVLATLQWILDEALGEKKS